MSLNSRYSQSLPSLLLAGMLSLAACSPQKAAVPQKENAPTDKQPSTDVKPLTGTFSAANTTAQERGAERLFTPSQPVRELALAYVPPLTVAQPVGRVGLWVYVRGDQGDTWNIQFTIKDAQGRTFLFNTTHDAWSALKLPTNTWCHVESYPLEAREVDHLPGSAAKGPANPAPLPQGPVTFEGITVTAKKSKIAELALADPVFSTQDRRHSAGYWQANDRALTVEENGTPFVFASDYATEPGDYRLAWRVENPTTGRVVGSGAEDFSLTADAIPARHPISLPELPRGSYQLKTRLWKRNGDAPAEEIPSTAMSWLLVFRGDGPLPADAAPWSKDFRLAVAPDNPSGIMERAAMVDIPYAVLLDGIPNDGTLMVEGRVTHYDGRPVATRRESLPKDADGVFRGTLPVALPEGENVFNVELKLKKAGNIIDRTEKLIGFTDAPKPWTPGPVDVAAIPEPAVYVGITAMGPKFRDDARYERHLRELKAMGFTGIEFFVEWSFLEPLPGCFTFEEMDRQIAMAEKLGFKIMLRLRNNFPRYTVPDWVDGDWLAQQDGVVTGLISGAPVFSPFDRGWTDAYHNFQAKVVGRYADDPAITKIKVASQNIREAYWVDRPFKYQFTDYSDSAVAAFRDYLRAKYGTVEAAAKAHGSDYAAWEDIALPLPYADGGELNLTPVWQDFCAFKAETYNRHLIGTVRPLHELAPDKPIIMYSINGLTGPPSHDSLTALKELNGALAAGGSLPIGSLAYERLYGPGYGLYMVTEPNHFSMPDRKLMDDHAGSILEGSVGTGPKFFACWPAKSEPRTPADGQVQQALARMADWDRVLKLTPRLNYMPVDVGLALSWEGMFSKQRSFYSASYTRVLDKDYLDPLRAGGIEALGVDDTFTPEMMKAFKVIVLPTETSPVISPAMVEALTTYVRAGGQLIMARESGMVTPGDPAGSPALLKALGLDADATGEGITQHPVGEGAVWVASDGKTLRDAFRSGEMARRLAELGVRRYVLTPTPKAVATLFDGQDGKYYLYVLNRGKTPAVDVRFLGLPGQPAAFSMRDVLNGGDTQTVALAGNEGTTVQLPLEDGTAGYYEIIPQP